MKKERKVKNESLDKSNLGCDASLTFIPGGFCPGWRGFDYSSFIAKYLKAHEDQKVYVVGHTDNIGDFDFNLDLSQKRAEAVVTKLIADYDVNAEQLKPFGAGPIAPVASNATEEGRAKNRRVEIVAQ